MSAIYERTFKSLNVCAMPLGELCSIVKGKQINGENLTEYGSYYVMNGGVEPSGYYDQCNVPANTISISEGGNSCGYVQYNTQPFWSGGHCYSLQSIDPAINNLYLFHYLKHSENQIMKLRIGSGLPNIQKSDLSQFSVLVPSISVQCEAIKIFDSIEQLITTECKLLEQYMNQKHYLLQLMFI